MQVVANPRNLCLLSDLVDTLNQGRIPSFLRLEVGFAHTVNVGGLEYGLLVDQELKLVLVADHALTESVAESLDFIQVNVLLGSQFLVPGRRCKHLFELGELGPVFEHNVLQSNHLRMQLLFFGLLPHGRLCFKHTDLLPDVLLGVGLLCEVCVEFNVSRLAHFTK